MSARVFNRFAMSEARGPRGPPPGQEIERARRVLFVEPQNCNQAAQARQVAAEELADTLKQKSQQWNFDFGRGVPLESASSRLKWQKQDKTERIPEAYALERLPFLSSHTDLEEREEEVSSKSTEESTVRSSRQSSITEYMPKRKSSSTAGCSKAGALTSSTSSVGGTAATEPAAKKQKTSSSSA